MLTASAPAEFGHAAGGIVNTVTKSGTNEWHGSAFLFLRDQALNAKEHFEQFDIFGNPIDAPKAPFHQAQWGATLGGPLEQDRTFVFLSLERQDVKASNFVTIDPGGGGGDPAAPASPSRWGAFPMPRERGWGWPRSTTASLANHRLVVRAHVSDRTNENVEPFGGIVARSHGAVQQRTDWGIAVAMNDVFALGLAERSAPPGRPRRPGDLRPRSPLRRPVPGRSTRAGPRSRFPASPSSAASSTRPSSARTSTCRLADTLDPCPRPSHAEGRLRSRPRVARRRSSRRTSADATSSPRWPAIPGLAPRPLSRARGLRAGPSRPLLPGLRRDHGLRDRRACSPLFAQDRWRLSPRLIVEAGLRYQRYALGLAPVTVSDVGGTTFTYEVPDRGDSGSAPLDHVRPDRQRPDVAARAPSACSTRIRS